MCSRAGQAFEAWNSAWRLAAGSDTSGATAAVFLREQERLTVANVGDTHAVLCRSSEGATAELNAWLCVVLSC